MPPFIKLNGRSIDSVQQINSFWEADNDNSGAKAKQRSHVSPSMAPASVSQPCLLEKFRRILYCIKENIIASRYSLFYHIPKGPPVLKYDLLV